MSKPTHLNLTVLASFLGSQMPPAARVAAVKAALETRAGGMLRDELGGWVIRLLPAETVVPEVYAAWRPLVRDAMLFMIAHLSAARLAPNWWNRSTCRRIRRPKRAYCA